MGNHPAGAPAAGPSLSSAGDPRGGCSTLGGGLKRLELLEKLLGKLRTKTQITLMIGWSTGKKKNNLAFQKTPICNQSNQVKPLSNLEHTKLKHNYCVKELI